MKKAFVTCLLLVVSLSSIAKPLVVYSGRSEALVGDVFEQFQKDTGIELDVRYNDSPVVATQLLNERDATPADVVFLQETGYLTVLGKAGLLSPLPEATLNQVPDRFHEQDGHWVGTSFRARVLAYNTNKVDPKDLPQTLEDFADPKWAGKIAWAPTNASFQAHVTALRKVWGDAKTEAWLKKMMQNHPAAYPKNAVIVSAVGHEEIQVGWVNHYYLHNLKKQDPNMPVANYSFPVKGDIGNVMMVVGVGVVKTTQQPEAAQKLVDYLLSEPMQHYFTDNLSEYPTRTGVAQAKGLPDLDEAAFIQIDQGSLADVGPTLAMLKRLGLL